MEYTTRIGSGPDRAHVNYQCPCGCIGGVIYRSGKALTKAGACCCGRKLWVGANGEASIKPYLTDGVDYEWDLGSVTLPWGEVAQTAMAWPKDWELNHGHDDDYAVEAGESGELVKDPVCGMTIDARTPAGSSKHLGRTYYFCAAVCKQRFDAEPGRFVAPRGMLDRLRRR